MSSNSKKKIKKPKQDIYYEVSQVQLQYIADHLKQRPFSEVNNVMTLILSLPQKVRSAKEQKEKKESSDSGSDKK